MTRKWIELSLIQPFDYMHMPDGAGFKVDAEKDGQTTEQHREGIQYIKGVLKEGQKIRPILVAEDGYGMYERLDGFKRYWSYRELGEKFIEAFVCTPEEHRRVDEIPYGDGKIRCEKGGLPKESFGLFEGAQTEKFDYSKVQFLYKGEGLRIELDEAIHVHWGEVGRYRLVLGRKDFEALAKAVAQL